MARGTTLATLRSMLKAECGYNMQTGVATAQDTELNQILNDMQQWLWSQYQWPFLFTHVDVALFGQTRYYTQPVGVSLDYPTETETYWSNLWYPVDYGIRGQEYEAINPDLGETQDPVQRWQIFASTQIEVWPVPAGVQTLRFWGYGTVTNMANDSATAAIDDNLIVFFTAAEKLARAKQGDAAAKLQKAQALFNKLKGANRMNTVFTFGGGPEPRKPFSQFPRKVVSIVGNPNH